MKIIKAIKLDKYNTGYTQYDNFIYKGTNQWRGNSYYVTLYAELEDGEGTQYPLEDILEKYYVCCSYMKEECVDNKRIFIFEVECDDIDTAREIIGLVGKRVYNYQDGEYISLGIE